MNPIEEVKPKDSTTLMVTFGLKSRATHYLIRITNDDGFFREDTVSSSPAEIKSLSPYTEYTLNIMAGNSGGRSQPSLPVTAKTGRLFDGVCCQKPNRPSFCVFFFLCFSAAFIKNRLLLWWLLSPCRSHLTCRLRHRDTVYSVSLGSRHLESVQFQCLGKSYLEMHREVLRASTVPAVIVPGHSLLETMR